MHETRRVVRGEAGGPFARHDGYPDMTIPEPFASRIARLRALLDESES